MYGLLPTPRLFIDGLGEGVFERLVEVVCHGQHRGAKAYDGAAHAAAEIAHRGAIEAPAVDVLPVALESDLGEYLLEAPAADDVARVVGELVVQRAGATIAHDAALGMPPQHPRNEDRGEV